MNLPVPSQVSLDAIQKAQAHLTASVVRTPLIKLDYPELETNIFLKPEVLQPIGSFKIRGAGNAIAHAPEEQLAAGIVTASAGNMAQGVAWQARRLGVPCHVVVPDHAPATKLQAIARLGGEVNRVPFDRWWQIIDSSECDYPGYFVHPVSDPNVVIGNATIGLEILDDLPAVDSIFVPFGGGGLISGIGCALHAAARSDIKLIASECATGAPLSAALKHGQPTAVPYSASFVDGIGSTRVLDSMWPLLRQLVHQSVVCDLEEIASAIRLLAGRSRIITEGAGAAPVAAAIQYCRNQPEPPQTVVCVVSGGNIDSARLASILGGSIPD